MQAEELLVTGIEVFAFLHCVYCMSIGDLGLD